MKTKLRQKLQTAKRDFRTNGALYLLRRKIIGRLVQLLQRKKYDFTPRRLWIKLDSIPITQPVFLLGVQGAGLTLMARTLYRNSVAVYATGNSEFWAGQDEIHNLPHIHDLPEELVYRSFGFRNVDGKLSYHPKFGYERNWLYAINEFLPEYRKKAVDATEELSTKFKTAIRRIIRAYAKDPRRARFVDMSQTYTVKAAFVNELLENSHPTFILVTRNPYAMCIRASKDHLQGDRFYAPVQLNRTERLKLAAQQWSNSYRCALADAPELDLKIIRFEDFLHNPEETLKDICTFIDFEYDLEMLPQPHHKFPLGSTETEKWYPIRKDVNRPYLENVDMNAQNIVEHYCNDLIDRFGYSPDGGQEPR